MSKELFDAIRDDNQDAFDKGLSKAVLSTKADGTGDTLAHAAVRHRRKRMFLELVSRDPSLYSLTNNDGDGPLHVAAAEDRGDLARIIVGAQAGQLKVQNGAKKVPEDLARDAGHDGLADQLKEWLEFEGLRSAARKGKDDVANLLKDLSKKDQKRLMSLTDAKGDTLLHVVASRNLPKMHDTGGDFIDLLVQAGADVDLPNDQGQTALICACYKANDGMVGALLNANAKLDVVDHRGWTALDQAVALGSLDPKTEKLLIDKGAKGKKIELSDDVKSTIDVLLAATLTDQTTDEKRDELLKRLRDSLEELYRKPEFRAILDLAALDALGERTKDKKPLRIFLADGGNTKSVNGDIQGLGSYSGDNVGVPTNCMCLGMKRSTEDLIGTLVHELTHHAAFQLYGNDGKPYPKDDDEAERLHLEAYEKMARSTHLALGEDEKDVASILVTRVAGYAPDQAIPEFVAGVPQAMYLYGDRMLDELAPQCLQDFLRLAKATEDVVQKSDVELDNDDLVDKVDQLGPPDPPFVRPQWVASDEVDVDMLEKLIGKQIVANSGKVKTTGDTEVIPCANGDFEPQDEDAHKKLLKKVRHALQKAFDSDALPPKITGEALRTLVSNLAVVAATTTDGSQLDKIIDTRVKLWTRYAQTNYIETKVAAGDVLNDRDIAEATVLTAELKAWTDLGDQVEAPEVDGAKHRKLVNGLVQELQRLANDDPPKKLRIQQSSLEFIEKQAKAIVGTKAVGFYKEPPKRFFKSKPDKVSVDVKNAKRAWLVELGKF